MGRKHRLKNLFPGDTRFQYWILSDENCGEEKNRDGRSNTGRLTSLPLPRPVVLDR